MRIMNREDFEQMTSPQRQAWYLFIYLDSVPPGELTPDMLAEKIIHYISLGKPEIVHLLVSYQIQV